ncbi:MAG: hypothetical protein WHV66_00165 [Anaerolineales bacterium]
MSLQIDILTGDALVLIRDLPAHSVDLIFTDPPYLKAYLDLYGWLGEQAVRVLRGKARRTASRNRQPSGADRCPPRPQSPKLCRGKPSCSVPTLPPEV